MNILLVRPQLAARSADLEQLLLCEPLELEYAAAAIKATGHCADIADMRLEKMRFRNIMRNYRYHMVVFWVGLGDVDAARELAGHVKASDMSVLTAASGPAAERFPDELAEDFDYVLAERAIETLVALVGEAGKNPFAIFVQPDLPELGDPGAFQLPLPARAKTDCYRENYHVFVYDRVASVKTARGASARNGLRMSGWADPARQRPLEEVLDELETLAEEHIFLVDDDFLCDEARLLKFCAELDRRGVRKHFIVRGRASILADRPDLARLLAAHGVVACLLGLKFFRQSELGSYSRRTAAERSLRAMRVLEAAGIQCYGEAAVGPDWTRADCDALIAKLNAFDLPTVFVQPRQKGSRAFHRNLLRVFFKTTASRRVRRSFRETYGRKSYRRVRREAMRIAFRLLRRK